MLLKLQQARPAQPWPQWVWPIASRIFPLSFPGGQQQRVAIARALINTLEILLADEPTGALDSHNSAEIMSIFQELNHTKGITIVLVTHSDEVAAYPDRIIRFRDGQWTQNFSSLP